MSHSHSSTASDRSGSDAAPAPVDASTYAALPPSVLRVHFPDASYTAISFTHQSLVADCLNRCANRWRQSLQSKSKQLTAPSHVRSASAFDDSKHSLIVRSSFDNRVLHVCSPTERLQLVIDRLTNSLNRQPSSSQSHTAQQRAWHFVYTVSAPQQANRGLLNASTLSASGASATHASSLHAPQHQRAGSAQLPKTLNPAVDIAALVATHAINISQQQQQQLQQQGNHSPQVNHVHSYSEGLVPSFVPSSVPSSASPSLAAPSALPSSNETLSLVKLHGWLYKRGKSMHSQFKRRYFVLVQRVTESQIAVNSRQDSGLWPARLYYFRQSSQAQMTQIKSLRKYTVLRESNSAHRGVCDLSSAHAAIVDSRHNANDARSKPLAIDAKSPATLSAADNHFTLSITTPSRVYLLLADSVRRRMEWIENVNAVAAGAREISTDESKLVHAASNMSEYTFARATLDSQRLVSCCSSLIATLSDAHCLTWIVVWLSKRRAEEQILFWLDVAEFKLLTQERRTSMNRRVLINSARHILASYIVSGAPFEISLSPQQRHSLIDAVDRFVASTDLLNTEASSMFDSAWHDIAAELQHQTLPSFVCDSVEFTHAMLRHSLRSIASTSNDESSECQFDAAATLSTKLIVFLHQNRHRQAMLQREANVLNGIMKSNRDKENELLQNQQHQLTDSKKQQTQVDTHKLSPELNDASHTLQRLRSPAVSSHRSPLDFDHDKSSQMEPFSLPTPVSSPSSVQSMSTSPMPPPLSPESTVSDSHSIDIDDVEPVRRDRAHREARASHLYAARMLLQRSSSHKRKSKTHQSSRMSADSHLQQSSSAIDQVFASSTVSDSMYDQSSQSPHSPSVSSALMMMQQSRIASSSAASASSAQHQARSRAHTSHPHQTANQSNDIETHLNTHMHHRLQSHSSSEQTMTSNESMHEAKSASTSRHMTNHHRRHDGRHDRHHQSPASLGDQARSNHVSKADVDPLTHEESDFSFSSATNSDNASDHDGTERQS